MMVCPMTRSYRLNARGAQQFLALLNTRGHGLMPTKAFIPCFCVNPMTGGVVTPALTCRFHQPGCIRKCRVPKGFQPNGLLCPVVTYPGTVIALSIPNSSSRRRVRLSMPAGKCPMCNHAGNTIAKCPAQVLVRQTHAPPSNLWAVASRNIATSIGMGPKAFAVNAKAASARPQAGTAPPLHTCPISVLLAVSLANTMQAMLGHDASWFLC